MSPPKRPPPWLAAEDWNTDRVSAWSLEYHDITVSPHGAEYDMEDSVQHTRLLPAMAAAIPLVPPLPLPLRAALGLVVGGGDAASPEPLDCDARRAG